jgi:glycosyltransferase involved in cell wall biosynthesis
VTISEFNRRHILQHYPDVRPGKVVVQRLGVDPGKDNLFNSPVSSETPHLGMLAVGRLHPVKDHAFLIRACNLLKKRAVPFVCLVAGEGPEREALESLICSLDLKSDVLLVGHLSHQQLAACYATADLVVLTSRSEGIPLVLMEAMARGKPVLAPAITGIPELVEDGRNGFLYRPGSLEDFVARVELVHRSQSALGPLCRAGRQHVLKHFNREQNLAAFCDFFLAHISRTSSNRTPESSSYANPILQ